MRRRATSLLVGFCLALAAAGAVRSMATSPLSITVRARALAPGEPVRVEVSSNEPLESVEGQFLGRRIFLSCQGPDRRGVERWSGWSMIGLNQKPGPAAVEIRARAIGGAPRIGTHAVAILPKTFPVEELTVAPRYVEPPEDVRLRLAGEREKLASIYLERSEPPRNPGRFLRPVPGEPTSIFGTRRLFNGKPRSPHPGLDLRASRGTPVKASGAGQVALAEDLYYSGLTVLVDHGGGLFTIYAHLSEILVAPGARLEAGALIGRSGATGRVTGPHLHWGAKIGDEPFDPTALLDPAFF